jgi:hypothetical protein
MPARRERAAAVSTIVRTPHPPEAAAVRTNCRIDYPDYPQKSPVQDDRDLLGRGDVVVGLDVPVDGVELHLELVQQLLTRAGGGIASAHGSHDTTRRGQRTGARLRCGALGM